MVIVIVRDDEQVYLRHRLCGPRIITGKGLVQERERCGIIAENRINQDTLTRQL